MPRVTAARRLDAALAAAVAAPGLAVTAWASLAGPGRPWAALALIGITAALMFLRRTRPALAAAVMAAAYVAAVQAGGVALHSSSPASNAAVISTGIAAAVLSYALGGSARLPGSVAGLALLTASLQWGELNPFPAMITVGLWLAGRAMLSQRRIAARLRIRAFELDSERERFAEEAVRYERDRIALELHDVIAHCVSIMVIQASAGQRLTPADAGAAGEMLGNIAELAREAGADIAGLSRLLLSAWEEPLARAQIEELFTRTAKTGVRLDYDIAGDVGQISGPAAPVTYRILQEGLTNAVRHAPGAAIQVTVTVTCGDGVRIEVVNQPAPAGAVGLGDLGSGRGLAGLAERTAAVGGTFVSGPAPAGGWRLSATLPGDPGAGNVRQDGRIARSAPRHDNDASGPAGLLAAKAALRDEA
jgi:signal transduction histidine kinase